ncbi:RxLR effector protein, partial [Phytophthora megakarya]
MRTMRLVSLAATVILLAGVVATEMDFNRVRSPQIAFGDGLVVRSLSSDTNHGHPKRMLRTNSDNANNS